MAEYLIKDITLTTLADEIRELSGVTEKIGLDAMTSKINNANTEIENQEAIIARITSALDGKVDGSGNGGVELPTLTNPAATDEIFLDKEVIDAYGNIKTGTFTIESELSEQDELLAELEELIKTKASASSIELPNLTNPAITTDVLSGKEFINQNGDKQTGTIVTKTSNDLTVNEATVDVPAGYYATDVSKSVATVTQATPSVSIDANGKITASATQTAGYVSAGTKSGTKQLTTQAAKTITPSKSSQTAVAKNVYTTGAVTVAAIPSQYITTTDATAVASEIFSGETAYVNGSKVTGTFTIENELDTQESLIAQIQSAVDSLPEAGDVASGICPSLTITTIDFYVDYIGYSSNSQYISHKHDSSSEDEFIIHNIDIGKPLFLCGWSSGNLPIEVVNTNIEILSSDDCGMLICKCTATDAATITITETMPWG